eukprot:TRINITY_DN8152_c0_g2_i1.p1 TRINITY_DN8152_c0_g2~~TRINITY_DN8152_c0_g2_i1.p1  ORF type:complete len:206 (-),score=31.90 TRINITY_DN8152_c0_g2_i1:210-827(-)
MQNWAGKSKQAVKPDRGSVSSHASASSAPWHAESHVQGEGKGKGKIGKASSSRPSKRFRADSGTRPSEFQRLKHLSIISAKLSLQTARLARLLFAQAVITIFVPTCSLTTAIEDVASEDPSTPELDDVQRWGELCMAILSEPKVSDEIKDQLRIHQLTSPDKAELLPFVLLCNSVPFKRDADMHRVQLKVSNEFRHLAVAVIKAL